MPPRYLDIAFSCEFLRAYGVGPTHDFRTPLTPLTLAVMQHNKYTSLRVVRQLIDSGADVGLEYTAMPPLKMVEMLFREGTFADDRSRERLAFIRRLLFQTDAMRAGSWRWPVCSPGGGVHKAKKSVDEGLSTMLTGMKRRVGTYQFVPRVRMSTV